MNFRNNWPTTGNLKRAKFLQTEFSFGCWTLIVIQKKLVHIFNPNLEVHLNPVVSHMPRFLTFPFLWGLRTKFSCVYYFFHACFIYLPTYPSLHGRPTSNNTSSRTDLKSVPFHILEFSSSSSFSSLKLKNFSLNFMV